MKAKWLKRAVLGTIVFLALAQLIRPARTNPPIQPNLEIGANLPLTPQVAAIFQRSCNDCHSNRTVWPWYSNLAPASWLVAYDVSNGRRRMNLSEWGNIDAQKKQKLIPRICSEVKEGDMPEFQYALIHVNARLSDDEKRTVCDWTQTIVQKQQAGGRRFPSDLPIHRIKPPIHTIL